METVVITGLSGAGKSSAMRVLEDMGYFCIDNLPPGLLPGLMQAFSKTEAEKVSQSQEPVDPSKPQKLAIGIDIRSLIRFGDVSPDLRKILPAGQKHKIIFMEASEKCLVSRYKQSRRNHPLAQSGNLIDAIKDERKRLKDLRGIADIVIDTSEMTPAELRDFLFDSLTSTGYDEMMTIFIQSFGFKYGLPLDADLVLDVRFLPNPFYIEELRNLSGLDGPVKNYIMQFDQVNKFLDMSKEFFAFSLPLYQKEGKVRLTIAVGCTGGRHRSVGVAEELAHTVRSLGYRVLLEHRDIERDPVGGL